MCYPPRSDARLTTLDSAATVVSESSENDDDDDPKETELSTSRHSLKRGRSDDDEATSKHTSSAELQLDTADPEKALAVTPISSRSPLHKKPRADAWGLDMLDDGDSE